MIKKESNLSEQNKKMTWFAMRACAYARLLYLRRKEKGVFIVHAPPDDIAEYQYLEKWYADMGFDQQQNLLRLMAEMSKDVLNFDVLGIKT